MTRIVSMLFLLILPALPSTAQETIPVTKERPRVALDEMKVDAEPLALGGFDIMTYYQGSGPKKGDPTISLVHQGLRYYFVSPQNRNAFAASPDNFTPEYGHACAFALGEGEFKALDPSLYIVEGQSLLLFSSPVARSAWIENPSLRRQKAEAAWRERKNVLTDFAVPIGG